MKIAINAPIWLRVPPVRYGGIEMVVQILADELVKAGIDVTLYASADSETTANLKSIYAKPQGDRMHASIPEMLHGVQVYKEADQYDLIHDHTMTGPVFAGFVDTPVLVTLHGDFTPDTRMFFSNFFDDAYYNSISDFQKSCFPDLNYIGTVYNAIDFSHYKVSETKEDFFLCLSRICEHKGTHLAVQAALATGNRLVIAGKIDPGVDIKYFEEKVLPFVDNDRIVYVGETSDSQKKELFSKAKGLLFPIQWAEPFGLVMVEALACGTPVIAFGNGAVYEIVEDNINGFIVKDVAEMIEAIGKIDKIDANVCHEHARKFSPERMAKEYVKLYLEIIEKRQIIGDA